MRVRVVLVLGDSWTFGWLVDKKDTIVNLLQVYADHAFGEGTYHFLNADTGGWGTADYVAYVEDFGDVIKPDIILVIKNWQDIERSARSALFVRSDSSAFGIARKPGPPVYRQADREFLGLVSVDA